MSHFRAYVLLPRQPDDLDDAGAIIGKILAPYSQHLDDEGPHLYDYWRIGGRWSGCLPAHSGFRAPRDAWDSGDDDGVDIAPKHLIQGPLAPPFTFFGEGYRTLIDWSEYPRFDTHEEWVAWEQANSERWEAWWGSFYDSLPGDAWLAVVDYHS